MPDAPGIDGVQPVPATAAHGACLWALVHLRHRGRVLGANASGDVVIVVGDLVGAIEYHGSQRGLRPLVACVHCGRRALSPVLLFRRRRDLLRPLDPILCASCSQGRNSAAEP